MMRESDYQSRAVVELLTKTNHLLELGGNKTVIFKAPTGSGKTVMMAQYLAQLAQSRTDGRQLAFIWTAPHQLHLQSKKKLEALYSESKALTCVLFDDLTDARIGSGEILFLNWESINKADNIYIRDNERDFNLSAILQNTRDAGITIILIIDESHYASKTQTSQALVTMFEPQITVEVTATPKTLTGDELVTVQREDVIGEGMIKKYLAINPGFENNITKRTPDAITVLTKGPESTDAFVLRLALEKRQSLVERFEALGVQVNPLVLIQLPDKQAGEADRLSEIEAVLLKEHGISRENRKLAIYLSEEKVNLDDIAVNDNEVEVMIFKQAIALGWDCPRACILVLFREWQSLTFSVQTVGRILRMPELKHYEDEELNIGFVFTGLEDLTIVEDVAGDFLSLRYAFRTPEYPPIHMPSVYSKRERHITRLTPDFIPDFLKAAAELGLKSRARFDVVELATTLMTDGRITDVDKAPDQMTDVAHVSRGESPVDIQKRFDAFARESLKPEFFPEMRSVGRVKDAIHYFFRMQFPETFPAASTRAQVVVLHQENAFFFANALNRAKAIYLERAAAISRELVSIDDWQVPTSRMHNNRYVQVARQKSIFQPFFQLHDASTPEKEFAAFLDSVLPDVQWFCKNGESDATWFAVPYTDEYGQPRAFYVDWIVMYRDGQIGLYDTKSGIHAQTAGPRAEGLAAYIKTQNEKGARLIGGIVVQKGGSWMLSDTEHYEYNPDLKDWKMLQ